jgi:hypothetical protein
MRLRKIVRAIPKKSDSNFLENWSLKFWNVW